MQYFQSLNNSTRSLPATFDKLRSTFFICKLNRYFGKMATLIRKLISTSNAPIPVAPYTQAVVADRTVYVSGCLGMDKTTMKLVPGGAVEQAEVALKNLEAVLVAADSGIDKVIKNTIFLKDLKDFRAVNEVYKKVFNKDFPARSCFQVAGLPLDAAVEIECIALTGNVKTVTPDSKL